MSRFADPNATATVELPCECPGHPHEHDVVTYRTQLGYAARQRIGRAINDGSGLLDWMSGRLALLNEAVVSWNLLGPDGKAVAPGPAAYGLLDAATVEAIADAIDGSLAVPLPNDSGAPSPG